MYKSIAMLGTYFQWLLGIAVAVITFRVTVIIRNDTQSLEDINLRSTFKKVSNHLKAMVICTLLQVIVELIKTYYF